MSAIAGIYHTSGEPVDAEYLERMLASLSHRGPHGSHPWRAGAVGLGHCAFRATPEAAREPLPLHDSSLQLALTADARLDNRAELLAALALDDQPPDEVGDGALILAAYSKWGEACPEKLLGDFAFAIWDGRAGKLFCARDHSGVKPFYYHPSPNRFAFASEIKALLCLPGTPRRLNETRLADYFAHDFADQAITFYQDIYRLPPAHCLVVKDGGFQLMRYWLLDPQAELRLPGDEAYASAFRECFTSAVGCRLRSAVPLGVTLSGGLDSSAIALVAHGWLSDQGRLPLPTFSAIFPELPPAYRDRLDEREYIDVVLSSREGFTPHLVSAADIAPLGVMEDIYRRLDEPYFTPHLGLQWALYIAAREQKVSVLLDGTDGDLTVSHGLERLPDLARSFHWGALVHEARALSRSGAIAGKPKGIIWRHAVKPLVPEPLLRARRWGGDVQGMLPLLRRDFSRRVGLPERLRANHRNSFAPTRSARQRHAAELGSGVIPLSLELLDQVSALFQVEARYPFFDRRLIEFCLALPAEQKLSQGWTRLVQRRAMQDILPPEVQWRAAKADFSAGFAERLLRLDRQSLEDAMATAALALEPYLDLSRLRERYQRYLARPSNKDAYPIFGIATLATWLQRAGLSA